jgi:hypothetical protein
MVESKSTPFASAITKGRRAIGRSDCGTGQATLVVLLEDTQELVWRHLTAWPHHVWVDILWVDSFAPTKMLFSSA